MCLSDVFYPSDILKQPAHGWFWLFYWASWRAKKRESVKFLPWAHHSCEGWVYWLVFLIPLKGRGVRVCHAGTAVFHRWFLKANFPSASYSCRNLGELLSRTREGIVCILCFWGSEIAKALRRWLCMQAHGTSCVLAHRFLMANSNLSQSCLLAWPLAWYLYIFLSHVKYFNFLSW